MSNNKDKKEEKIIDPAIANKIKKKVKVEEKEEENKVLEQYIRIIFFTSIIIFLMFITMKEAVTFSRDVDNSSINWKTLTINLPDFGYNLYDH
jgi:hypothetical protein